ncbi:WXG100 family type VII secretion target [Streptomyces sp. AS02]|uniref:WXG100 family type VII secretion target n=1 Tax=Streptomyces sp. AS02 TaxID=2938946 RepID=UPI00201FF908|nr:WXG100 family type VII secretion target [Streptomyces sp. AS02]MCL8014515.1 WXG100 family type VII secretion target [Streptomyces sp. AS02]
MTMHTGEGAMGAGQVGTGYQVQAGELDSEADKLDAAGDDTAGIRTAITATQCYTPEALGGSDMGPAFSDYAGAWEAEAKTLSEALHELADRVRTSNRAYGGAEGEAVTGLRAAQSGGGIVAPVAYGERPFPGGISTQPAQADPGTTPSVFG